MTGRRSDPKRFLSRRALDEELATQQREMIKKMANAGLDLARKTDNVMVDVVTLQVLRPEATRMCRFLPLVAKRERSSFLGSLQACLTSGQMAHARYGVITMGAPVVAMDVALRPALEAFHRKLSRWANGAKRFGIDVLVRATESTRKSLSCRGMAGNAASYHFHANVIYRPRMYCKVRFATFLRWTRRFFGTHWKDNGVIKDVREVVKYMIKPAELSDASGEELVWLFQSTQKLKMTQALGPFAEYRRNIEASGYKAKTITATSGERELVFVKKDKRAPSSKDELKEKLEAKIDNLVTKIERAEDARLAELWVKNLEYYQHILRDLGTSQPPNNFIVAVLPPATRFIHYATPVVVVTGFTSIGDLLGNAKFEAIRESALSDWVANGAPDVASAAEELHLAQRDLEIAPKKRPHRPKNAKSRKTPQRQPNTGQENTKRLSGRGLVYLGLAA